METRKIEISKENVMHVFDCDVEKETKLKIQDNLYDIIKIINKL
jgi:hypothetical protein